MSRSFHATHAAAARVAREDVSRPDEKRARLKRIRADLRQKQRTKRSARVLRRRHGHAPTPAGRVPVERHEVSPFVHYPADVDDVREVLRRLPRGVTDGLAGVTLRPGIEASEAADARDEYESGRDPFIGRPSVERFPGAWSGRVLGQYRPLTAEIDLYGYVFEAGHPHRHVWMPLLRAEALGTLAHEVAHHHDHTARVARGRWIAAHTEVVERYAESIQHRWMHEVIIPFLRERYADEIAGLERWIERHGGLFIPFDELVGDPRVTGRGGRVGTAWRVGSMSQAVEGVLASVQAGDPAHKTKLRFAYELHLMDRYEDALRIVDGVLRERPGDPDARLDRADLLWHMGRNAEALELARALVGELGEYGCPDRTVMHAAEALGLWSEAIDAASAQVERARRNGGGAGLALLERARLRAHAGDVTGARADLDAAGETARTFRSATERIRRAIVAAETGVELPSPHALKPRRGWWV